MRPVSHQVLYHGFDTGTGILELPFYEDSLQLQAHRTQQYSDGTSTFYRIADGFWGNSGITVTADSNILKIPVFDLLGMQLYANTSVNDNIYTVNKAFDAIPLIVQVQTEQGVKTVEFIK